MSTAILNTDVSKLTANEVRSAISGCADDIRDFERVYKHVSQRNDLKPAIEQGIALGADQILGMRHASDVHRPFIRLYDWVQANPSYASAISPEQKAHFIQRELEAGNVSTAVSYIENEHASYKFMVALPARVEAGLKKGLPEASEIPGDFAELVTYVDDKGRSELTEALRNGFSSALDEKVRVGRLAAAIDCVVYLSDKPKLFAGIDPQQITNLAEALYERSGDDTAMLGILKAAVSGNAGLKTAFNKMPSAKNVVAFSSQDTGTGEALVVWVDANDDVAVVSTQNYKQEPSDFIVDYLSCSDPFVRGMGVARVFDGLAQLASKSGNSAVQHELDECRDSYLSHQRPQIQQTYRNLIAISLGIKP